MSKCHRAHVKKYLEHQAKVLEKLLHEKSDVHQFRVTLRRLRAGMRFVKKDSKAHKFTHRMGSSRNLGRLRELEVALKDAKLYRVDDHLIRLRLSMMQKRNQLLIGKHQLNKLVADLKASLKNIKIKKRNIKGEIEEIQIRLNRWQRPLPKSRNQFHRFRIDIKRARYAMEALGCEALLLQKLQKLQDILGRGHDLAVLQRFVGRNQSIRKDEMAYYQKASREIPSALRFIGDEIINLEMRPLR
jgi:CHAD domain-containing protein